MTVYPFFLPPARRSFKSTNTTLLPKFWTLHQSCLKEPIGTFRSGGTQRMSISIVNFNFQFEIYNCFWHSMFQTQLDENQTQEKVLIYDLIKLKANFFTNCRRKTNETKSQLVLPFLKVPCGKLTKMHNALACCVRFQVK